MSPNAGSTKWRLRWGSFRGSSLNLGWSKHGIWWVDQWVPFSWLHIESFWCHWRHAWILYSFGLWHFDYDDLIILIRDSDTMISFVFHWYTRLRHWHADYIDWSYCLAWHIDPDFAMIVLITSHAYTHHCISLSLTCCFSYLYTILIVFEHVFCITIRLDCCILAYLVCTWLIYTCFAWLPVAWLFSFRVTAWVACLCGPHFYPPTSKSLGLGHFLHFGSHFCKCETFCVLVLWPSQRLGVGSSDGLYRCMGAFWRRATLWCRLESDHWRPV